MLWKTSTGKIIDTSEMSDDHLHNSYKVALRRMDSRAILTLYDEIVCRREKKFFDQTQECPYCGEQMKMIVVETIEVGFSPDKYQFSCKCGSRSPFIEKSCEDTSTT